MDLQAEEEGEVEEAQPTQAVWNNGESATGWRKREKNTKSVLMTWKLLWLQGW